MNELQIGTCILFSYGQVLLFDEDGRFLAKESEEMNGYNYIRSTALKSALLRAKRYVFVTVGVGDTCDCHCRFQKTLIDREAFFILIGEEKFLLDCQQGYLKYALQDGEQEAPETSEGERNKESDS